MISRPLCSVIVYTYCKLQALVYDILPSTTAVFSFAIGSRKLLANEYFVCLCPNSSKFVTNNSNKTRRVLDSHQQRLHQCKQYHKCLNQDGTLFFIFLFLSGVVFSHVCTHAWALGYFYSHISTRAFQRALTASVDSCVEMKSAPSVT